MNDRTSSVRVEVEETERPQIWSAVQPLSPKRSRGPLVGLVVLALIAFAAVWISSDQDDETAASTPTSVPAETLTETESVAPRQAPRVPVQIDQRALQSITALDGELIAAATGRDELLWSSDDGATWEAEADGVLDRVVAVGDSEDEPRALVRRASADGAPALVDTMVFRAGQWVLDSERPPLQVSSGRERQFRVGSASMAIIETAWDRPVAEVSDALAREVDRSVADATCSVTRRIVSGTIAEYDLANCDGEIIGVIDANTIEPGGAVDDQLAFAQEVLRKRSTVHLSSPDRGIQRVELAPSQLVLDITLLDDGFVAFVLDSVGVLDNVDLLYSQAFTASLIRWDAETETMSELTPPARASAWSANRVVAQDDGSIVVVSPIGMHRAVAPFDDWTLIGGGEFEPRRPGRIVNTALHGDGFFVRDPGLETGMYVSCCGEDWELVDLETADFRRMLVASDDALVFGTVDGRIVKVDR